MKNLISGFTLGLLLSTCAATIVIPVLAQRTLDIHPSGRLVYKYCVDRSFFAKKCKEWKEDFYDISIAEDRAKLSNFQCSNKLRKF